MNIYTTTHWTPPLKKSTKSKKKTPKQTPIRSQLYTIDEENKPTPSPLSSNAPPHEEVTALLAHCNLLEQKLKSTESVHSELLSRHAELKKRTGDLESQIVNLKQQGADALEALDQALSSSKQSTAPQQRLQHHLEIQIQELASRNRVLEERCTSLSAWADLHRMSTSKLQSSEAQLLQALSNADRQHSILQGQHTALQSQHSTLLQEHNELKAAYSAATQPTNPTSLPPTTDTKTQPQRQGETVDTLTHSLAETRSSLQSAETRAANAERSLQKLLGAKLLLQSAPVSASLLNKSTAVLQSTTEVLRYAKSRGNLLTCVGEVCSALSALDEDLFTHAASASAWLAKRDVLMK